MRKVYVYYSAKEKNIPVPPPKPEPISVQFVNELDQGNIRRNNKSIFCSFFQILFEGELNE